MSMRFAAVVSLSGGLGYLLGLDTSADVRSRLTNFLNRIAQSSSIRSDVNSRVQRDSTPLWYQFLPVAASVHAATAPIDKNLPVSVSSAVPATSWPSSTIASPTVNRVGEIMKHGYPGMDTVRFYEDFVVSYDRRNRVPHWVFERISKENCTYGDGVERSKCGSFREDETIHPFFRSTNADYKQSGYDRGHLAAASNHRHSLKAMDQTFVLSNIAPQVGAGFNRGVWNSLEKYTRALARKNRCVYVCTGPLYLPRKDADGKLYVKYEVIGQNHVAVPTHFFKVLVVEDEKGEHEMKSFVLPNAPFPEEVQLKTFQTPIETIERAAGLVFFEKIPRKMFRRINSEQRK